MEHKMENTEVNETTFVSNNPKTFGKSKLDGNPAVSRLLSMLNNAISLFNQSTHDIISSAKSPSIDRQPLNTSAISDKSAPLSKIDNSSSENFLEEHQVEYACLVALATVAFIFGMSGNLAVIGRVLRQGVLRARIRMLLLSLSCADVLLMLLEFPLNQFAWMSMRFWRAGDFMCRASAFGRAFAAYLISFVLVVISLDRCLNTIKPTSPKAASRRMKKMLLCALGLAIMCALPQWLIFQISEVPGDPLHRYQCVSRGLIEDDNMTKVVYPLLCMIFQYIIPVVLISLDYAIILYVMSKPVSQPGMYKFGDCQQQLILFRGTPTPIHRSNNVTITNNNCIRPLTSAHDSFIRKAQMKTLRILVLTVAAFIFCWLPYYVVLLFYIGNPVLANAILPYWIFKISELLAVCNACINPFIYGNYLLKVKAHCKSCWS